MSAAILYSFVFAPLNMVQSVLSEPSVGLGVKQVLRA